MYNYNEYFNLIDTLVSKVSGFNPVGCNFNCVIGLLRGGYLPAEAISRCLETPLAIAKISSYNDKVRCPIFLCEEIINKDLIRGNVLIVDDLIDSGNTLKFFVNYLKVQYNVDSVKTAVLWNKEVKRDIEPDFYSIKVPGNEWIVQPLEKYGD